MTPRCGRAALGVVNHQIVASSGNWKRKRELSKAQINLNLPQHSSMSVLLYILFTKETLQNSYFYLYFFLQRWGAGDIVWRILEQEEAIHLVLRTDRKTAHVVPTWQDMEVFQCI